MASSAALDTATTRDAMRRRRSTSVRAPVRKTAFLGRAAFIASASPESSSSLSPAPIMTMFASGSRSSIFGARRASLKAYSPLSKFMRPRYTMFFPPRGTPSSSYTLSSASPGAKRSEFMPFIVTVMSFSDSL